MSRAGRALATRATLLLALASALVAEAPSFAATEPLVLRGGWVEARSDHFLVVGDVKPKRAKEIAGELERMHELFRRTLPGAGGVEGTPLLVLAADGERTMKALMPSRWKVKGATRPAGLFVNSTTREFVVLRGDQAGGRWDFSTVYHEYFHYLVGRLGLELPVWLNEGLACFWGETRLTSRGTEIGRVNENYLAYLRQNQLWSLERLLSADGRSPEYRRAHLAPVLYSQSWLLVHYLTAGDESGTRRAQFAAYMARLGHGDSSLDAARSAFGDLAALEKDLQRYLRGFTFHYATVDPIEVAAADRVAIRELAEAEASARVAAWTTVAEPADYSAALIDVATRGAPDLAATHEAVGILAIRSGRFDAAREAFGRATALPEAHPVAHYGWAVSTLAGDTSREALGRAEQALLSAYSLDRGYAPALARLADVYRRIDEDPRRALVMIRRARRMRPENDDYTLREAQLLAASGETEAADRLIGELVSAVENEDSAPVLNNLCWEMSFAGFAGKALPLCDRSLEQRPDDYHTLDSRGVARALAGDLEGAAEDFERALRLAADEWSESLAAKRRGWLGQLRDGVQPFEGEALERLLDDPEEDFDWGA